MDEELARIFDGALNWSHQTLHGAIVTVTENTGCADGGADDDGTVHMEAVEVLEVARLAGLPQNLEGPHEAAYVDRFGEMHLPVELAEHLAHAYASAEPEMVLMSIEDVEGEYKEKGHDSGGAGTTTS